MKLTLSDDQTNALAILLNRELMLDPESRVYTPAEWDEDRANGAVDGDYVEAYVKPLSRIFDTVEPPL